jgi:hypothetical protein
MQLSRMTRGMNCHSPFVYPKLFAGEGKRKCGLFIDLQKRNVPKIEVRVFS